jgi:hypothetical protein
MKFPILSRHGVPLEPIRWKRLEKYRSGYANTSTRSQLLMARKKFREISSRRDQNRALVKLVRELKARESPSAK